MWLQSFMKRSDGWRCRISNRVELAELKKCQERFRSAMKARDSETLNLENNRFHAIIGDMANSVFMKPSFEKLLIDHARIGHTFFDPTDDRMQADLQMACKHHDKFIEAIAKRDDAKMINLVYEHWELSRKNMELYVAPKEVRNEAIARIARQRAKQVS